MFSLSAPSIFLEGKKNHARWKEVTKDSWHQLANSKKMSCHLNGTLMSLQSTYDLSPTTTWDKLPSSTGSTAGFRKPTINWEANDFLPDPWAKVFFRLVRFVPFVAEHTLSSLFQGVVALLRFDELCGKTCCLIFSFEQDFNPEIRDHLYYLWVMHVIFLTCFSQSVGDNP